MTTPTAEVSAPPRRPPYLILIAMSAVGPISLNIFVPSMPGLQATFGASTGAVQLTLTVYIASIALCQLLYGPLSDRFGRRPLVLAGLALYVAASLACALAPSLEFLIAARGLQAIGGASGMILSRAIVRDLFERDKAASVLGYITMAWVVAPMIAPTIGGFLDQAFSFRAGFVLLTAIGAVVLVAAWRTLPETNAALQPDAKLLRFDLYGRLLGDKRFMAYALTTSFSSCSFFCYLAMAPFLMVAVRGHTPIEYGMWAICTAIGYMAGNFVSGRYSTLVGADRMVWHGNMVTLLGAIVMLLLALAGVVHPAAMFLPMILCAFGNGLTLPNGITAAISVDPRNIGSVAGLAGFMQMTIGAIASQIVGAVQYDWHNIGFWVILAAALIAAVMPRLRDL